MPAGSSIAELLERVQWQTSEAYETRVLIAGEAIERERWSELVPPAGTPVVVRAVPKDPATLAAILAFAAQLAAAVPGAATIGGALAGQIITTFGVSTALGQLAVIAGSFTLAAGAITFGIQAALNALIPTPDQDFGTSAGGRRPSPALQGVGNQIRPFEPIPSVYGRYKVFPPFLARPFTEIEGGKTVARMLFGPTLGTAKLSDIRIQETPIASFEGVELQIREGRPTDPPIDLFSNQVLQEFLSGINFRVARADERVVSASATRTTATDIEEIGIDLSVGGLFRANENGKPRNFSFKLRVRYRNVSGGSPATFQDASSASGFGPLGGDGNVTVTAGGDLLFKGRQPEPFLRAFRWKVEKGQYEVEITRIESEAFNARPGGGDTSSVLSDVSWIALKGVRFEPPIDPNLQMATLALRIPLTDQIGGLVQTLSCVVDRELPVYDPGNLLGLGVDADGWTLSPSPTRNAAAILRDIYQGVANGNPLPNSRLDIPALSEWFDDNEAASRTVDIVFDTKTTVQEAARDVARSSRADLDEVDGKISIVQDKLRTPPVDLITPATSHDFEMERRFDEIPHMLRVLHVNPDEGYQPNWETKVFDDGFSEDGSGGTQIATRLETLRLPGAWTPQDAWKEGRFFLAALRLRPRTFRVRQGLPQIAYRRGDPVLFGHDGALIGQAWGRIKEAASFFEIHDFDSTTGLGTQSCSIAVDGQDFREGTGSIQATATFAGTAGVIRTLPASENWTARRVRFWVKPSSTNELSATDGIRFHVTTGLGPGTWAFGTDDGLRPGVWTRIDFDPNTRATILGAPDLSDVLTATFQFNPVTPAIGAIVHWDLAESLDRSSIAKVELEAAAIFQAAKSYAIQFRVVDDTGPTPKFTMVAADVVNPVGEAGPDQERTSISLVTPLTAAPLPVPGDPFAFGEKQKEVRSCIVKAIRRESDLFATVELLDQAPAVYQADQGPIPPFDPGSSPPIPPSFLGPDVPAIESIISDERALKQTRSGDLVPRILIQVRPTLSADRPAPAEYEVQLRRSDATEGLLSDWKPRPRQGAEDGRLTIEDVDEEVRYDLRVRAISIDGRPSDWVTVLEHLVVGKTTVPPDVSEFRLEGQQLLWSLPFEPADLRGFRIRYNRGINRSWDDGTPAHGEPLAGPPFSTTSIPTGLRTLLIRAEDRAGILSDNAAVIIDEIGGLPPQNVVNTRDLHAEGFPRVSDENVELFDSMDAIGSWTTGSATLALEPDEKVEGTNAFKVTSSSASIATLVSPAQGGADWSGRSVRVRALIPDAAQLGATDGLRVVIFDTPLNWSWWFFGTDDGLKAGKWNTLQFDPDTRAPNQVSGGGPVDLTDVHQIRFDHNVVGAAAGRVVYWDLAELIGGGTLETTEVEPVSGDLVTKEVGSFYSDDPAAPLYAADPLALFYDATFLQGAYRFEITPELGDVPSRMSLVLNDDIGVEAGLEYRTSDSRFYGEGGTPLYGASSDPFYRNAQLAFSPWPGFLDEVKRQKYAFRLSMRGGNRQGRVTQLDVVFDVPDEVEEFNDFEVTSGLRRLPLTKAFRQIREVQLTLQKFGAETAFSHRVNDKQATLGAGPEIETFDASGVRTQGHVDARVVGVQG